MISVVDGCKVYTPIGLARAMVAAAGLHTKATWLEPSVGKGVFLRAIAENGVPPSQITACEIDPTKHETDSLGVVHRGIDFLSWAKKSCQQFDRIVGNPPFIRSAMLPPEISSELRQVQIPNTTERLSGRANLWFAFLCACLHRLSPGGNIALVLPASWEYAGYAQALRNSAHLLFRKLYILRSHRPMFGVVQDGSVIFVGRGFQQSNKVFECFNCDGLDSVIEVLEAIAQNLIQDSTSRHETLHAHQKNSGERLGDLLEIRLGGVTGQARFFVLSESERRALNLPTQSLLPILSKSHHVAGAEISVDDWKRLRCNDERVWLFRPSKQLTSQAEVRNYLERNVSQGGCDRSRYKIRSRDPWYMTSLPSRINGFLSGMSSVGPFLCFRRMNRLNATNTLYVFRFRQRLAKRQQFAIALAMLTSPFQEQLSLVRRHYPSGLQKIEPGDLQNLILPRMKSAPYTLDVYSRAIKFLLSGAPDQAHKLADCFLE